MTGIPAMGGAGPAGAAGPLTRARAAGGFAVPGAPSATPGGAPASGAGGASAAAPALALAGLLALQESEPAAVRDRAAHRHGKALLAALATLQRALLDGTGTAAATHQLGSLLAGLPPAADPALAAVLAAVALRCRIELARRG